MNEHRTYTVFGAGSVGTVLAGVLADSGLRVALMGRGAQGDLLLEGDEEIVRARVRVVQEPEGIVLLCVHDSQVAEVCARWPRRTVVTLCNGVTAEAEAARTCDVIGGVWRMTCTLLTPGHAIFTRRGRIVIVRLSRAGNKRSHEKKRHRHNQHTGHWITSRFFMAFNRPEFFDAPDHGPSSVHGLAIIMSHLTRCSHHQLDDDGAPRMPFIPRGSRRYTGGGAAIETECHSQAWREKAKRAFRATSLAARRRRARQPHNVAAFEPRSRGQPSRRSH